MLERQVKGVQLAPLDAVGERQEELLEARVRLEELLAGESVGCEEVAWDKVGEDEPSKV